MLAATTQYMILYNFILFLVIVTAMNYIKTANGFRPESAVAQKEALFLLVFMIVIIAFRDWRSPLYGDSFVYGRSIALARDGANNLWDDWGFNLLFTTWAKLGLSPELFFILTATVYCVPMYLIARRLDMHYTFLILLFFASSFTFFAFGVNGIRNGMASSLVLLAMTYKDRKYLMALLLFIGFSLHDSMMLPIAALIITMLYTKTSFYIRLWIASILVSVFVSGYFQQLFLQLDFVSSSGSGYLGAAVDMEGVKFARTGYRWDFVMYSGVPVLLGYYITEIKKESNEMYTFLLNTYLLCNSMWILVIRANYSNRIAYLSWFIMPIVMVYPIIKFNGFKNKNIAVALILLPYFLFSYIMWVIKPYY